MQITFTLSPTYTGATYVAGPFNIYGTTCEGSTYTLASGVTKTQLTTGYTVNTTYETMSGGTIESVGTCNTTQSWTSGISCGGAGGGVTLEVYGQDLALSRDNQTLYYSVNSGPTTNLTNNAQFPSSCQVIGTITGLSNGDTVTFSTVGSVPIAGTNGGGNCPGSVANNIEYTTTIDVTSGYDYCSLSIQSGAGL